MRFERAGGQVERLHVNRLLEVAAQLADFQILCLPGGFSYGDDIAAGRILGNQIRHHLADCLNEFKAAGKLILGICNGFQILIKSGVLLPLGARRLAAGHAGLERLGQVRRPLGAAVRPSAAKCVFFAGIETMYLPVAHAEGKFVPR